jgi:hypothetical protein
VLNGKALRRGGIWDQYQAAALRAVRDRASAAAGRCTFTGDGHDLVVTLPSGRDLLCWAMLRCERAGLAVTAHVHDELIVEVPRDEAGEALRRLVALMSSPPPWAAGFPTVVEGFASPRYTKAPFRGWPKAEAKNGVVT